jgi:hypothetical protein
MSTANELSINLPPELLAQTRVVAQREQRSVSEIVQEALTSYLGDPAPVRDPAWRKIFEYGRARGRELGITCEEDVDRILGEFRTEKRNRSIAGESRPKIEVVQGLRERFRDTATELGISSDDDIERLSSEYRASRHP